MRKMLYHAYRGKGSYTPLGFKIQKEEIQMRNLKRTLSLVMAMALIVGMMVVSASAVSSDFNDSAEITNTEAVDVMTAIGVFEGTDKGAFNPTGILTREQAAKIVAVMLLGEEDANKLSTNSTTFKDVAANRWSAGYIGYCVQQGILAGTGNGNFDPEGELTGLAFAKMMLVALGYDADRNRAPVVLAKGADHLALKIVEVGEANGVYILEDRPLARGLYASVEVDMEIPEEYYQTVAKILAFVYKLNDKKL